MALPQLNTPTFELELPSSKEKIKYRPFLVKEQKVLMLQNPCDTWSEMENIAKKHGEQLLFMGEGYTFQAGTGRPYLGGMAFFVDQEKGNWTVFQVYGDGIACMLFNGTKFKPYSGD